MLDKVSWFHGSKSFGCGRKYQSIKLADSCTESDSCDVIVGLYIFNPTLQDAGYYKMSIAELGLESSLHKLEVDNGKIFETIVIFGRSSEFDDLTDNNFRWDRIHQKCKLNRYGNFGKNTIIGINILSWNKIQNSQLYRKLLEINPRKLIPNLIQMGELSNSKKHSMVEIFDASGGQCSVKFVERCEHFPFNISEPMSVQKLQILNREEMILKEWQPSYQQIITQSTTVSHTLWKYTFWMTGYIRCKHSFA